MRAQPPRSVVVGAIAFVLLLGACGNSSDGSGDDGASAADEALPTDVDATTDAAAQPPSAPTAGQVDLVGADVVAASNVETNLLPDVVLDDVSRGVKVNFRNLVPQDKPILLWAYAPH